jgi:hypothetical protein
MSRPGPASFTKRKREMDKKAKRQTKLAQRAERRALKAQRPPRVEGVDPDLIGIRPGPQPRPLE